MLAIPNALTRVCAAAALAAFSLAAPVAQADGNFYSQHNLVSDVPGAADNTDPNLVNAWGIAFNPTGPVWIADNGMGLSTLYNGAGTPLSLVVQIPGPVGSTDPGTPTGIVFNTNSGFPVTNGTTSGASRFIFVTEDGVIAGWSPGVDPTHALRAPVGTPDAVYKGLAIAQPAAGKRIYAADFHGNHIEVYDATWTPVPLAADAFKDASLPSNFAPFNVQNINGSIYVSYAMQDSEGHDEVAGRGFGYVRVYDTDGTLLSRLVSRGKLNAPWGMTMAPATFGKFANKLLVGNFGDGTINAYDPVSGEFEGNLKAPGGHPIQIDGLWGLAFGNNVLGQDARSLFFTAGPADEGHGLYGRIDVVPGKGDGDDGED